MKPTDEERREVAKRLRDFERLRDLFKESNVCAFSNALGVGYMDWEHICARLADLIEPEPERTCMPIMPPYEPGVEEIPVCSECGRQMFIEDGDAYCPRCGAKVIEEES